MLFGRVCSFTDRPPYKEARKTEMMRHLDRGCCARLEKVENRNEASNNVTP